MKKITMIEKRKQPRFKGDDEIYVYNSSRNVGFAGKMFDISRSGISFSYVMDVANPTDLSELDILIPNIGFVTKNLPFETVYDEVVTNDIFVTTVLRRRGGRFHSLTPDHINELERFIENLVK